MLNMKLHRSPRGGGEVTLERVNGRWEVWDMIADVSIKRRHRFWIVAYLDFITC